MYVRIEQDSIKFRISREQAERLLKDQSLDSSCRVSPSTQLLFKIIPNRQQTSFSYYINDCYFQLNIAKHELQAELAARPSKQGIQFEQEIAGETLLIALQIDIKKSRKLQKSNIK
jgi:hypothetical protein